MKPATGSRVEELVGQARLEAMPFGTAKEQVMALPQEVVVTVTCSAKHGLDHTLAVAERWARHGRRVVPHIAARLVRSSDHLTEILARLGDAGLSEVFVIGGDAQQPGPYPSAGELIAAMGERPGAPSTIGIGAYPEGHPGIDAEALEEALLAKQPFAAYLVTQICFDPATLGEWIRRARERGVTLPVLVGIPGAVQRRKLMQISLQVGVGGSLRFLTKQGGLVKGLVRSRAFEPTELLRGLEPYASDSQAGIAGFHIYTFNEIAETMKWRTAFASGTAAG